MNKRIMKIVEKMGAKHVRKLPDVPGGAFGMARLARLMQARLSPSADKQPQRANGR
jgi:hypothetical protein